MLNEVLLKTITSIKKDDLEGCEVIGPCRFYKCENLKSVEIPYCVKNIEGEAFAYCTSLTDIDTDEMDPYCKINTTSDLGNYPFLGSGIITNLPTDSVLLMANGKIMIYNTFTTPSKSLVIPDTVINLAAKACAGSDNNFKSFVIPDSIEIICDDVVTSTVLTKITIGKSARYIGARLVPKSVTTLIFKQPAEMEIELPTAGSTGMAYDKDSRSISIYTDNECIKNYDWATDNVTATFYPLSEAPE